MNGIKRAVIGALSLLLVAALIGSVAVLKQREARWQARAEQYRQLARQEKDWIMQCQTEDGLILYQAWDPEDTEEDQTVMPYFSSIAALGLLSGTVTPEQADAALAYQRWYLDYLNRAEDDPVNGSGTIYDWTVIRSGSQIQMESTGSYDSVDSYAALFLLVADRYQQVADTQLLQERPGQLLQVVDALLRTLDENGLSCAKSEYPVQYVMDNSEVYAGLGAAESLLAQLEPEGERLERVRQAREKLAAAMDSILWNQAALRYEIGVLSGKPILDFSWEEFYPDSICQLFPICFGVIEPDSERSIQLYERFCEGWAWQEMELQTQEITRFFWCSMAYTAALREDEHRLERYIANYQASLVENGRGYPLYTGDSGWMALACSQMETLYEEKEWWNPFS